MTLAPSARWTLERRSNVAALRTGSSIAAIVLTTTLRENGAPIWAVIALTIDAETMSMAQMLERSQTITRGTGRRQGD